DGRDGLADQIGGLAPSASQRQGDVVLLDSGQARDVGAGPRCHLERIGVRVIEGVVVCVGHGSTLGRCRLRSQDWGRMGIMSSTPTSTPFERTQRVAILGGGPGGYEAALAAAQL